MLTGRVAGLEVIAANGRPGSTSEIRIRGTRSLSGLLSISTQHNTNKKL